MKPFKVFPSKKGVYKPVGKYNPQVKTGFSALENWKIREDVLSLGPGVEPAFPNRLLHPLKLEDAAWTKWCITTSGRIYYGIDGTLTAQKISETVNNDAHYISKAWLGADVSDNVNVVYSVYATPSGRTKCHIQALPKNGAWVQIDVDLTTKTYTIVSGSPTVTLTDCGGGCIRITMTYNMGTGASIPQVLFALLNDAGALTYAGDASKGMVLWGSQVQFGTSKLLPFTMGVQSLAITNLPLFFSSQLAAVTGPHPSGDTAYYYISGQALRKIVESGEDESVVNAAFLAGSSTSRLAWAAFRNHILTAHKTEGLSWLKPTDDTNRLAGVIVPTAKPTATAGAAGALTGLYKYTVTFVNDKGHEGNPKLSGTVVDSADVTLAAQKGNLTSIPLGPTGTSSRRIYRTIANGGTFMYLTTIGDNSTTTLTGDNAADSSLGTVLQFDNDIPTLTIQNILATSTRVYLVSTDGQTLWASKIDPFTSEPNWEAYPYDLSQTLPFATTKDTFQAAFELGGFLYCAGRKRIFRIQGDIGTGVVVNKVLDEGFFSRFTWMIVADRLVYLNGSKKLRVWTGDGDPKDVGEDIQDLLQDIFEPSGLLEPSIVYNETDDEIYLSYTTAPGDNINKGLLFDQKTGKVSQTGMILRQPFYQPTRAKLMGTGGMALYTTEGYRAVGSRWATQIAETIPITPVPGDECTFGRIILQVKAVPIVAFVPPTLKVEYALDEGVDWKTKYVDLTRDFLSKGEGNTAIVKTVYVPVHDRAGSIKIRVSTVDNVASLDNGVEIYDISVEVINEAYEQEEKKNYAVDRKAE
jgi:hypothetical protein